MVERLAEQQAEREPSAIRISGGKELSGTVSPGGSKNASFPILAGAVLLSEPVVINNVPKIDDTHCFIEILDSIGAQVEYVGDNSIVIDPRSVSKTDIPVELGNKIRGSYYFLGALLSRFGEASIPQPGGCNIGERPMDQHFVALGQLGYEFQMGELSTSGQRRRDFEARQSTIVLPFPSRGATINTLLASSLLDGNVTELVNYNKSPEALSLVGFLQSAGVNIRMFDDRLYIEGKSRLALDEFSVIRDKIEVATLLTAGIMTKGEITVENVNISDVRPFLCKLDQIGIPYEIDGNSVSVRPVQTGSLKPTDVISGLKPTDIDADFEPILASLLCTVQGDSHINDEINPGRHSKFISQLNDLGASIEQTSETHAIIHGGTTFRNGAGVCNDIRGGVSLLLAMLSAEGDSTLSNLRQIQRGYENLDGKLLRLGAEITQINE